MKVKYKGKEKRGASRKQKKVSITAPVLQNKQTVNQKLEKNSNVSSKIQVGSAEIENLGIQSMKQLELTQVNKNENVWAYGDNSFQSRQKLVEKLTEPVLKTAAIKHESQRPLASPLKRLPTFPLQHESNNSQVMDGPILKSARSAIKASDTTEEHKSEVARERNKDILRMITKSKEMQSQMGQRRLILANHRNVTSGSENLEVAQQQQSRVLFSSKAADRISNINFFSPDKIYQSISTIQDKYPNLKIDPQHIQEDLIRPAKQSMTTKKERAINNGIEGIISPSRQSNRTGSDARISVNEVILGQSYELNKQQQSRVDLGSAITRTKQLEVKMANKDRQTNVSVRKIKSMRKSKYVCSTTVESNPATASKKQQKQQQHQQSQGNEKTKKKAEIVQRIFASEQLINNIIRERKCYRPSVDQSSSIKEEKQQLELILNRTTEELDKIETAPHERLGEKQINQKYCQAVMSPTSHQSQLKSTDQSLSGLLFLGNFAQRKEVETMNSPVHGSGLQAIHKLKQRKQTKEQQLKGLKLHYQNSLQNIDAEQNDKTKTQKQPQQGIFLGSQLRLLKTSMTREFDFSSPPKKFPAQNNNESLQILPNLSRKDSDLDEGERRAQSSLHLSEQGSQLRQNSVDAAAEKEREKIRQIISSKSFQHVNLNHMHHYNTVSSGEKVIDDYSVSDIISDKKAQTRPCPEKSIKNFNHDSRVKRLNICDSSQPVNRLSRRKVLDRQVSELLQLSAKDKSLEDSFATPNRKTRLSKNEQLIYQAKQANTAVKNASSQLFIREELQKSAVIIEADLQVRNSQKRLKNKNMRIISMHSDNSRDRSRGYNSSISSSLTAQFKHVKDQTPKPSGTENEKMKKGMRSTIEIAQSYQLSDATVTLENKNEGKLSHDWDPKSAVFKPVEKNNMIRKQISITNQRQAFTCTGGRYQEQEIYGGSTNVKQQLGFKVSSDLVSLPEIPLSGVDCVYGNSSHAPLCTTNDTHLFRNHTGQPFRVYKKLHNNIKNPKGGGGGVRKETIKKRERVPSRGSSTEAQLVQFQSNALDQGRQSQPAIDTKPSMSVYQNDLNAEVSDMPLMNVDSARIESGQKSQHNKKRSTSKVQVPPSTNANQESQLDNQQHQQVYSSLVSHRNQKSIAFGYQKSGLVTQSTVALQHGRQNQKGNTVIDKSGTTPAGTLLSEKLLRGVVIQRNRSLSNQGYFLRSATNYKNLSQSQPGKDVEQQPVRKKSGSRVRGHNEAATEQETAPKVTRANKFVASDTTTVIKDEAKSHTIPHSQVVTPSRSQRMIQPVQFVKVGGIKAGALQTTSNMNITTAAINSFKPCRRANVHKSYRIFTDWQDTMEILEPGQLRQCIAICLEGLCAVLRQSEFSYATVTESAPILVRNNLLEALNSFRKATGGSVTLILYTNLSEKVFDEQYANLPGLKELWSGTECPIERIIFLPTFRLGIFEESELAIEISFLPKGTQEILWVHPFNLEYNEVLSRLKDKKYTKLLYDGEAVRFVQGLPFVVTRDDAKQEQISEFNLLVSSLDFDIECRKSASMLAIMKTIQSLYFLGKITHLISQQKQRLIVPAVITVGLVPAPIRKPIKPTVTFSFQKSFKTVKEHMLLSLVAFLAPSTCFHAKAPPVIMDHGKFTNSPKNQKPISSSNWFSLPSSQTKQQSKGLQQVARKLPIAAKNYAEPKATLLRQLDSTNQIMDLAPGNNFHQSFFSFKKTQIEKEQYQKPIKEMEIPSQPQQFISYLQPTMSSQAAVVNHQNDIYSAPGSQGGDRSGMTSGVSNSIFSPRNAAKQKLLRDLTRQNREIAKHVKQYARLKQQKQQSQQLEEEKECQEDKEQDQIRNIMVLDGWLIEKFPLIELTIPS